MSNYNFNYAFNISGNCNAVVAEISGGVENLQRNLRATTSLWDAFEGKILALNQFTQYVGNLSQSLNETLSPGAALNAIAGITKFIDGIESTFNSESGLITNNSTVKNLTINFAPKDIDVLNDVNNIEKRIQFEKLTEKTDLIVGRQPHTISRLRINNTQGVASVEDEIANREMSASSSPLFDIQHLISFGYKPRRVESAVSGRESREAIAPLNPLFITTHNLLQTRINEIEKIIQDFTTRNALAVFCGLGFNTPKASGYALYRIFTASNYIDETCHIIKATIPKRNSGIPTANGYLRHNAISVNSNENQSEKEKIKRDIRFPLYGGRTNVRFETLGLREIGTTSLCISGDARSRRETRYEKDRRAAIQVEKMIETVVINHNSNESSDIDTRVKESLERILARCVEDISTDFYDD